MNLTDIKEKAREEFTNFFTKKGGLYGENVYLKASPEVVIVYMAGTIDRTALAVLDMVEAELPGEAVVGDEYNFGFTDCVRLTLSRLAALRAEIEGNAV